MASAAASGVLLVDLVMDQIRRVLAVVAIVVYGPGLLFWFLVHPLARFWRKLGPAITYLIVITALALIGLRVFQVSGTLIGRDLEPIGALSCSVQCCSVSAGGSDSPTAESKTILV
jgi:hypothetical protein